MAHSITDLVLGSLLWLLALPLLLPLLPLALLYRGLVSLCARIKYSSPEPMNYYDTVSGGTFISYAVHAQGSINLSKLVASFRSSFLGSKSSRYPAWTYSTTNLGGYGFKVKTVSEPDLSWHIREILLTPEQEEPEALNQFLFSLMGNNERLVEMAGRPMWELLLLQCPSSGRSILLLKIDHGICDAFSYFFLLNTLTGNGWEVPGGKYKPPRQSPLYKIGLFLKTPWVLLRWIREAKVGAASKLPFGVDLSSKRGLPVGGTLPKLVSSTTVEFSKVKAISQATSSKVLSVLMALHFWSLKKAVEKLTGSPLKNISDPIPVTLMLPRPHHPALTEGRTTNHMAFGNINHLLSAPDRLSNLRAVEAATSSTSEDDTATVVTLIYSFLGSLLPPSWVIWGEGSLYPAYLYLVTPFVAPSSSYRVQGHLVDKFQLLFNGTNIEYMNGIAFGSITKGDEMEFTLGSSHELFLTQKELDEHVQVGMRAELDALWEETCLKKIL